MNERSELIHQLINSYITTSCLHHNVIENQISTSNCHLSQHRLLTLINSAQERRIQLSQKELAKRMEISPAAIAVTLKKMEANGLISKSTADDTRINNIQITKKGKDILQISKALFDHINNSAFDGFTDEEIIQLNSFIERMKNNLKTINQPNLEEETK